METALLVPQKAGPMPLGNTMYSNHPHSPIFGCVAKCKEGLIQTNGDGMYDTLVYAQGALWGGVNTEVLETLGGKTSVHAGVLYWVVNALNGSFSLGSQGYVAARGEDVLFPSIGVGPTGNGILTFTLTGKDYYPSTAYAVVSKTSAGAIDHKIFVADLGMSPYDALTEYQCIAGTCPSGTTTCRGGEIILGPCGQTAKSTFRRNTFRIPTAATPPSRQTLRATIRAGPARTGGLR